MLSKLHVPIGAKIFGIATSMLGLLLGVSYVSSSRIRQVNHELINIADYLTPLTEHVAKVNVHALEQEIRFERINRLYETEPIDSTKIEAERAAFEERGHLVDQELEIAMALAQEALHTVRGTENIAEFSRVVALLEILEEDHQRFYDASQVVLKLYQQHNADEAAIVGHQLEKSEDDFDHRIQSLLFELGTFTEKAAFESAEHEQQILQTNRALVGIASGVGLLFATVVTSGLLRPVRKLVQSTEALEQGDLALELPISSRDEIGQLTETFNQMVHQLRDKERLKNTFGQYVDPRIVETLLQSQKTSGNVTQSDQIVAEKQVMTVFFSDIAGFSGISEMLTPVGLVTVINQYLTLAAVPINEHGGVVNQFIGDAVSAFWGPPFVDDDAHARLACYAALEQFGQLAKLKRMMPDITGFRKGLPDIQVRIGLATGEVVTGNIGSENSKSYTVMGPTVQLAEQLEGANKIYGTSILMTERTRDLVSDVIVSREIGEVAVGKEGDTMRVFEPLGSIADLTPTLEKLCEHFQSGLIAYRTQSWADAIESFQACLRLNPQDGPSQYYLNLCTDQQ